MQCHLSRSWPSILAALSLSLAATPSASAQEQPEANEEMSAREHFQRGSELADEGECDAAIDHFEAGYELSERALFLFNVAECAREVGRHELARKHYERYLDEDPEGVKADAARQRLEELPEEEDEDGAGASESGDGKGSGSGGESEEPAEAPTPSETAAAAQTTDAGADASSGQPLDTGSDKPIWTRWPLWVGVGAAVAAAVVIPVALTQSGGGGGSGCGANCEVVSFDNM